ncbi:MAG: hypothetical protein Q7R43_06540 [Candidatus Daviesbacteria bacterium]|nr:hypothetical protein [Candidatus Daviesbacteria bacterium]
MKTKDQKNLKTQRLSHKCFDCGCELILMEETTATMGNNLYPITKSTYRCPNSDCQEESDKRTAKRVELRKDQDAKKALRLNKSKTI